MQVGYVAGYLSILGLAGGKYFQRGLENLLGDGHTGANGKLFVS
jgi:hypothetical protein